MWTVLRWRCRRLACNLHYLVICPFKTRCKITILKYFLYCSWEGNRFLCFGASWSPMASWSPRCLPDASLLNDFFSMILLPMIPPQWSLLYDCSSNDSSSMILRHRFLFHDFSSWFTKNSVWGLVLGSYVSPPLPLPLRSGFCISSLSPVRVWDGLYC